MTDPRPRPSNTTRLHHHQPVILRPLPKVIFLYPLLFSCLVLGVLAHFWPDHLNTFATLFIAIAFLNLGVLAFDIPQTGLLTVYAFAAAIILGIILIQMKWADFLPGKVEWALGLNATANSRFYFAFAIAIGLLLVVVLLARLKAEYVRVTAMEIKHYVLLDGAITHPRDKILNFGTEKPDMLEYGLLRCGRVWIQPAVGRTIVIEHVPRIDEKAKRLEYLFSMQDVHEVR